MEDADPETQALIRKLHREMNGLGRRAARSGIFHEPEPLPKAASRDSKDSKSGRDSKAKQSHKSGHFERERDAEWDKEKEAEKDKDKARERDKERDRDKGKPREKTKDHPERDRHPHGKHKQSSKHDSRNGKARREPKEPDRHRDRQHDREWAGHEADADRQLSKAKPHKRKAEIQESSGKRAKVSGKASRAARWHGRASMGLDSEDATSEDTGSSSEEEGEEKEEAGPSGKGVTRHPGNPEGLNGYAFDAKPNGKCRASEGKPGEKDDVPAVQDIENAAQGGDAQNKAVKKEPRDSPGWLTNAALLAAKQAKERAKLQGNSEDIYTKYRRVKCFHADARFGVALPTGSLATRQVLAQALTSAFGRWGLKCGDGRELHVLFLDAQGNTAEFPPQRPTDGAHDKEQAARWREASLTAVRVYVR